MLTISFNGILPPRKEYLYSVRKNAKVNTVAFVFTQQQGSILLDNTWNAYIKVQSVGDEFVDKDVPDRVYFDNSGHIIVEWTLKRKHTEYKQINVQVQFENGLQKVWQGAMLTFVLANTINADEEIVDKNPTIIQILTNSVENIYVEIGEMWEAINQKQPTLVFDDYPTANSDNPVKSKGIKQYVDDGLALKQDVLTAGQGITIEENVVGSVISPTDVVINID